MCVKYDLLIGLPKQPLPYITKEIVNIKANILPGTMQYVSLKSWVALCEGVGEVNTKERGEQEWCLSLCVRSQGMITFLFKGWLGPEMYVPGNLEKWAFDL